MSNSTVFKVGDIVWHDKFGRGEVAEQGVSDIAVMFDTTEFNIFVSTEPPPYMSKEEVSTLPWQERVDWTEAKKLAPLNDHIIWWDLQSNPDPSTENPKIKSYKYPATSGYFKVDKVLQSVGMRWDVEEQRLKFFLKRGKVDISMVSTKGGQKFKVNLNQDNVPALPTARILQADSLSRLQEDSGWTLPEPKPEVPEEPEVSEDESK